MKINITKKPANRILCQHPLADVAVARDGDKIESVGDWKAAPFPLELWLQVVAFFKSSPTDEVQVRLYYNAETRTWAAHAHPQNGMGMTTRELPDHPDSGTRPDVTDPRFVLVGTIHSHCNADAFQSSTDETNEVTQDGLHITIGKINGPRLSLHARCYFQEWRFDISWEEIFGRSPEVLPELPEAFATPEVKAAMLAAANKRHLEQFYVPANSTFPTTWANNVIRIERTVTVWGGMGNGHAANGRHTHHYPSGGGKGVRDFKPETSQWIADLILLNKESTERIIAVLSDIVDVAIRMSLTDDGTRTIWGVLAEQLDPSELNRLVLSNGQEWRRTRAIEVATERLAEQSSVTVDTTGEMQTALSREEKVHGSSGTPKGYELHMEEIEVVGAAEYADHEWSAGRMTVDEVVAFRSHYGLIPPAWEIQEMREADTARDQRARQINLHNAQQKSIENHEQSFVID